jgi:hypothetical protein
MYDKSCFINSPPSPLPLPSPHVASKGKEGTLNPPPPPPPPSPAGIRIQNRVTVDSLATSGVGGGGWGWGGGTELSHSNGFHLTNQNAREFTTAGNNFYIELYALPYCNNVGQMVSLFAWHKSHQIAVESLQAVLGNRYLYLL